MDSSGKHLNWRSLLAQFALPRLVPILPGITAGLLSLGLWQVGAWQALERVGYNSLFSFRQTLNRPRWDSRIVVIAIDKASLKQYGGFPWTRDSYTKLLRSLEVAPPAVIGLDIIFAESTSQDSSLAEAIAGIGNVVLATGADEEGQAIPIVPSLINVAPQGHVYNRSDSDGISRQAVLYFNQFPSFGIAALQVYQETIRTTIKAKVDRSASQAISLPPPTPGLPEQTAWINWIDTTQTIPTYSLKDVVQGKIPTQAFADKIVLVGATSTGLDPLHTPLNHTPPTSGVYLHAAVIDNLLNHRFLQSLPNHIVLPLLMLLGLGTNLILLHQKARGRVVLLAMLVLIWFSVAVALFTVRQYWLPVAAPIGTMLLTAAGLQLREQHEKQLLMTLFAKHLDPEMAEMIWQHRGEIAQAGEIYPQELVATVLFMDIRGFTSIAEKLEPRELLNWLNRYLDLMTGCIMEHKGVVDKYIGDGIMAVFGVPFPSTTIERIQQDAINAIAASLSMHQHLQGLNQCFQAEGKPLITIGIGIHTGSVVAGSVGGSQRMNYSVLGDTVNIAARLEAMNKNVLTDNPYNLLVTNETLSYLQDRYRTQLVGDIQLRGRKQRITVFSILGTY